MSRLHIVEGKNTPEVNWDTESGVYTLTGKSFPENSKKFYNPILDWIDGQSFEGDVVFEFYFYYLSSSSIIAIYQILKRIEAATDGKANVDIVWKFDEGDDDIERIGEDYQKITSLNISTILVGED
jgi:hypothetical protein